MNKAVYQCGIVGFGYMGEIRKSVIERQLNLSLTGICERNPVQISKIQGVPVYASVDDLLKKDLDIVFVCTPNVYAPEIAIKCLKKGIHVFCEKPPGRNVQDIMDIQDAERNGVKLMFGFNHRFHPGIIKAKVVIESGRLGKIINLRGLYGKSGGKDFKDSWRNEKSISGGGILLDQGIHMLDLFRHFGGEFDQVRCFTSNTFWKLDVEDNALVILRGRDSVDAICQSSATFWKHTFRLDITLEGGYMVIEGLLSKSGSYGREQLRIAKRQFEGETEAVGNPSEEITYFDRDNSWDLEVEAFVQAIQENKPVTISSSHDALKVMQLIESAYVDAGIIKSKEVYYEEHRR